MPVLDKLTNRAKFLITKFYGAKFVSSAQMLSALKTSAGISGSLLTAYPNIKAKRGFKISINNILTESFYQAHKLEHSYVGTEHILLALLKLSNSKEYDQVKEDLVKANLFPQSIKSLTEKKENVLLDSFGSDLTRDFKQLYSEPLVYREELDNLIAILLKKDKPNALIVGNPGIGKKTLVKLLAKYINSLDVPPLLAGHHVVEFDMMAFISSIANKGAIDLNLLALKKELLGMKRVIVVLKNFQNMFISTSSGVGIPILFPMIQDVFLATNIKFIATMNESVYGKVIVDNEHIFENFTTLDLEAPEDTKVLEILKNKANVLGEFHNITVDDNVVSYIFKSAKNIIKDINFPQKGIELMDRACTNLLVQKSRIPVDYKSLVDKTLDLLNVLDKTLGKGKYDNALRIQKEVEEIEKSLTKYENSMIYSRPLKLKKQHVDDALIDLNYSDDPAKKMSSRQLLNLAPKIKQQIIGQHVAVDSVVKALIRSQLGLRPKKRPIGAFLFLGPTGVGKTELAKVLASQTNWNLIRLDMSDFGEKHNVSRLVGAPPGYVGYSEGGELTSKIEANPSSIVLFDEIEKAHPDVLNILLQILEEGELADAKGTVFDFSKAVVILTSNIGTEILHNQEIGFTESIKNAEDAKIEQHLKQNLKKILKPELLNRFDEIVVFKRLTKQDQFKVLSLQLADVSKNLVTQGIKLKITKTAKDYLLEKGYSHEYGARSLRRVIETELLDKVAEKMLRHKGDLKKIIYNTKVTTTGIEII